jgi:ligand-binding sensor domain-containing protein
MKMPLKIIICIFLNFISILAIAQVEKIENPKGLYAFTFQEDLSGSIWVGFSDGSNNGSLGKIEHNILTIVGPEEGAPSGSYHNSIKLPDGSLMFAGNIIGTNGNSVLVWVSSAGIDTISIPFKLSNPFVNCITLVNRREIWIGTASGLLINNRGNWQWFTIKDGLPDNFINSIYQDFRGVVWIGTEKGIASFMDGNLFSSKLGTREISSATQFFSDNRGYLWCGSRYSSQGVSVYNGQIWETFSAPHGLADNSSTVFHQDNNGILWVGSCYNRSRGGVSSFDGKKWSSFSSPDFIAKPCVDAIITDTKGRTWFGGSLTSRKEKGIAILDNEKWHKVGGNQALPAERIINFFMDSKGNIWISSFEGLFFVDKNFNP